MNLRFGIDESRNEIVIAIVDEEENGKSVNISIGDAKQLRDEVLPQLISILENKFIEIEKLLK